MLEAAYADLAFIISLKRSTQNLQLSTKLAGRLPHLSGGTAVEKGVSRGPLTRELSSGVRRGQGVMCYRFAASRRAGGEELIMHTFSFVIFATSLFWPAAASAQLNVLISGGFSGAYEQLLPEFERTSGIKVTTGSGASQGAGPQTIAAQLARGVPANVVILSREGLSELIAAKRIVAGTAVDLARVPLGVAVRAGAPKPDVSTVEAFKQVLLKAKTVAVPGSTSGIWLVNDLFPRLGIADKINAKVTPRGTDATGMVAAGGADLVVMPVSEIVHAAGVDFAGSIAPEIQFVQTFSAAVVAGSGEIEGSQRLIEFLASARAFEVIRNSGMEPLATSR
jgi:molybdate transport system substrate-binding protein